MTKQIFGKLFLCCAVAVAIVFSSYSIFAQTGPAGSHDEFVKRLQDKLAAINNEVLISEITPILNEAGEADLGAKLVESFLGSVGKINEAIAGRSLPQNYEMNRIPALMESLTDLGKFLDECDQKALLIQTYYDSLSPDARTNWSKTATARMTNGSKPTVDALRALNLIRPANAITQHCRMSFLPYERIKKQLDDNQNLEPQLEKAAANLAQSKRSQYDDSSYDNSSYDVAPYEDSPSYEDSSSSDSMSPKPEKPPELTLIQQVESLVMGTATAEQVLPLCQLLAAYMDNSLENKRNELAKLRTPKNRFSTSSMYGSSDSSSYDSEYGNDSNSYDSGRSSPSFRSNTVTSVAPINVAGLMNVEISYFMARTLKPMVLVADEKNKDTLFKAWCALGDGGSFTDPLGVLVTIDPKIDTATSPSSTVSRSSSSSSSSSSRPTNNDKNIVSRYELLSVLSDYRLDIRIQYIAGGSVMHNPDLSLQMCFNIGNPILFFIKQSLADPMMSSQEKVTLIEAVQYIDNPDAAEFLIPLLVHKDKAIVDAAADAIGAVGDSRASKTLVKGLANPRLAEVIIRILKKMGSNSQNDIIAMFKDGNPEVDKFCVDILQEGGDLNALPALSAVLRRYHNALSTKDLPQSQKSEMLMLTMRAGVTIVSRNMGKTPPSLTVPVLALNEKGELKLDYGLGTLPNNMVDGMQGGMMGPGMVRSDMVGSSMMTEDMDMMGTDNYDLLMSSSSNMSSTGSSGTDGTSSTSTATMVPIEKMVMQLTEVQNNGPYLWLEMIYMVAAKHISDSATLMEDVRTDGSGKVVGTTIRTERVDREFFRKVLNTSEEGLSVYLLDEEGNARKNDVRKLKTQKERVTSALGKYKRQENRIAERKSAHDAFVKASTGIDPNAKTTGEGGAGTTQQRANPLGTGF